MAFFAFSFRNRRFIVPFNFSNSLTREFLCTNYSRETIIAVHSILFLPPACF